LCSRQLFDCSGRLLEGGAADALGRERYVRGEGEKAGNRNGYRTGKVKTAEGAVEYSARRAWEKLISQVPSRANRAQEACTAPRSTVTTAH
jgi:hypothetical protein